MPDGRGAGGEAGGCDVAGVDGDAGHGGERPGGRVLGEAEDVGAGCGVLLEEVDEVAGGAGGDGDGVAAGIHRRGFAERVVGVDGEDGDAARAGIGRCIELLAVGAVLIGEGDVEELACSVDGCGCGEASGDVVGVLGVEFSIGSDGELYDAGVIVVDRIEEEIVRRDDDADGVSAAGVDGRVGEWAEEAGLVVDLVSVDEPVGERLCGGHVEVGNGVVVAARRDAEHHCQRQDRGRRGAAHGIQLHAVQ